MDIDTSFKNTKRKLLTNEHRDFFKFYDKTNFPKMRRILRDRLGTKIGYDINYDGDRLSKSQMKQSIREKIFLNSGFETVVIKEAYGLSGSGMKKISAIDELNENISNWIKRSINKHDAVYVEPWNDIVFEFSGIWSNDTSAPKFQAIMTDKMGQFKGHQLRESFTHSVPKILRSYCLKRMVFSNWQMRRLIG